MKISFLKIPNNYECKIHNCKPSNYVSSGDVVSFGYLNCDIDDNLQVYRSISQSELSKLLKGEKVHCKGYVTSDPRGWGALDWNSGYINNKSEPVYFVKFKKGCLHLRDIRDHENDTRYGFSGIYSLNNVETIHIGANAHGEIVYASDFEKTVKEDKVKKISKIKHLINSINTINDSSERKTLFDELSSYCREFPEIVSEFSDKVDYLNTEDMLGFTTMINAADSDEHLPLFRKCLHSYLLGVTPSNASLAYFIRHGKKEDLSLIFDLLDSNIFNGFAIGNLLASIADENDKNFILENLSSTNLSALTAKTVYFLSIFDGVDVDSFRDIIQDVKLLVANCSSTERSYIVSECAGILGNFGDISDIDRLRPFYDSNNPYGYPSLEVAEAIKSLGGILN